MRKKIIFLISCIIICFNSCSKQEECFSCNIEVDNFVKMNKNKLYNTPINQFEDYDTETQRSAFRMFDTEKKQEIWIEKYQFILDHNPNNYSYLELESIKHILDHIIVNGIFDDSTSIFLNEWVIKNRKEFQWTDDRLRFMLMSLAVDEDNYLEKAVTYAIQGGNDCDCNKVNRGILLKDCSGLTPECNKSTCSFLAFGCGYLWKEQCDGECGSEGSEI